ncbi:MAG: hypothetical protein IPG06_21970 [Haliea sp.]|nr:hypothetical protein [Haliea sp.]
MKYVIALTVALLLGACGDKSASVVATEEVIATAAQEQVRGFVFSKWEYDIPDNAPECPEGLNITDEEFFPDEYAAVREEVKAHRGGRPEGATELLPVDACKDPGAMPDPGFKLFEGNVATVGLDLDGVNSTTAAGGQCAHNDFTSADGRAGIDYQYWRLMGCVSGMRPGGLYDRLFDTNNTILENGYSTLLEMKLTSGTPTDGKVEMRLFTSAGPVTRDANGKVVPDMSQLVHEDTMFHSAISRRDQGWVLTAGPVDAKMKFKVQAIDKLLLLPRPAHRANLLADGSMDGVLAGYWDGENIFDFMTEVYIGPVHLGRSAANNLGYQCAGLYHAIPRVADGHPDPKTGKCTSVSTVILFSAVPAFIIMPEPGRVSLGSE